ncbi:Bromodomain-containing protein [Entamoeba marina]
MQENQKKVKQKQTKGTVTEKLVVLDTKDVLKVEKDIARLRGCALSSALKSRGYVVDFNINSAYHYTVRSTQAFYQQRKNRKPHEIEMEINERKKNVKKPKPPRDISSKSIKSKYSFKRKLRSRPKRHNFALDDDLLEIDNLDHITINSKDSFDHFDGVINIDNVDSIGKEFINRSDSIEEKEYNKGKIVVDVTPNTNMNTVKIIPKFSPTIGKYSFNESQNIITVGSVEHYPNLIIGENQQEISCINVSDENISNVEIVTPASQKNCIKETKELCTNDPQSYLEKQVDSNTNYDGQELCFSISSNSSKTRSVIQKPIKPPKTQQTEKTKNKLVQPHSTKFFRNEHIQESLKKPRKERKELDKNLIACRDILNKLKVLPEAGPFLSAVDPVAMNLPDYYYVVTNPMDLGTVQKKMRQRKYSTVDAFASDVRLVFS